MLWQCSPTFVATLRQKMALILGSVSRTLECSEGPKSQNDKMRYTNIYVPCYFYLGVAAVACWNWKLGRFDFESQTDTRNGMDFEFLTDSFENHGYPHNISLFVEIWSNSLWLSKRNSMRWSRNFVFLEGPRCSLMPFLHYSYIEKIETRTVSKHELLALKPS